MRREKDGELREDIRFLGRLLGDTIREQAGTDVFDLVESIRRTAIHYRKEHDRPSLKHLERTIGRLGSAHATNVVRAFSYFHHLANAAEDLNARRVQPAEGTHRLRVRAAARRAHVPTTRARLVLRTRARRAGADRAPDRGAAQEHARPAPRDHRRCWRRAAAVAARRRDREGAAPRGPDPVEDERAARCPSRRWPTRSRTGSPISARRSWTRSRASTPRSRTASGRGRALAPFLRVASWIGGDRDGNPHVTAEVTEHAAERQASVVFAHYLARDSRAGRRAVAVVALRGDVARAAGAGGALARSRHQPRRGAVPARARRHLRARRRDRARAAGRRRTRRPAARRRRAPYARSVGAGGRSGVIATALADDGAALAADGRLRNLIRDVDVFGFHLVPARSAPAQRGPRARRVGAARARDRARAATRRSPSRSARRCCCARCGRRGRWSRRTSATARRRAQVLATLAAAARVHARFGERAIPNYVISMTAAPSDVLEVALLLKEAGLLVPGEEPRCALNIIPLFETIEDLRALRHRPGPAVLDHLLPQAAREPRRHAGGDARLLGQQQGRRLPDVELGAVQGRAVDRRGLPAARASACACSTGAAAPSGAAAGRATAPCSRSRRAA